MNDVNIILGLDIGDRRIGVAVGNLITRTASPLPDLYNNRSLLDELLKLHQQYNFSKIIVGLPMTATGQHGSQAHKVKALIDELTDKLPSELILEDERFTTQSAEKILRNQPQKGHTIDGVSAQLILEGWLDRQVASKKSI